MGQVFAIDSSGPLGADVNWPLLPLVTTGVGAGSSSKSVRLSAALGDSQLDAKQG